MDPFSPPFYPAPIPLYQPLIPTNTFYLGPPVTIPGWDLGRQFSPSVLFSIIHPVLQQPAYRWSFSHFKSMHWRLQLLVQIKGPPGLFTCHPDCSVLLQPTCRNPFSDHTFYFLKNLPLCMDRITSLCPLIFSDFSPSLSPLLSATHQSPEALSLKELTDITLS